MSPTRSAWLPTPRHLPLLKACLWQGKKAHAAWVEWRSEVPRLAQVERGSIRLLPLAYFNLGSRLAADPDAGWLRDAYRNSWANNQLRMNTGRRAIEALQSTGIEVLVLKGAALAGSAYRDLGARPMGDVDLAVPSRRAGEAARALRAAGFAAVSSEPELTLESRHSLAFRDSDGREVDLHRAMLWRPGLEEKLWHDSVEAMAAGTPVRILNPADQLLHVCAHGAAWNPVHPVRWAADASKVLEAAGKGLDWDRLVEMAKLGRLSLPLHDALGYLAAELQMPAPASVIDELGAIPVSRSERRAQEAIAQAPSLRRSAAMLWWFWESHRAQSRIDGKRPTPAGMIRHMQGFWGLERASLAPGYAARRLLRSRS